MASCFTRSIPSAKVRCAVVSVVGVVVAIVFGAVGSLCGMAEEPAAPAASAASFSGARAMAHLEAIVAKNMSSRAEAVASARRVVDAKVAEFGEWARSLSTGRERSLKHSDYRE